MKKVSGNTKEEVLKLYKEGKSFMEIGKVIGVSYTTIFALLKPKTSI